MSPPVQRDREMSPFEAGLLVLVLLACFLPYVSLGPLAVPSQVQPWGAVLAWFWVILRVAGRRMRLSGFQLLLVAFGFWFMVDVYGGQSYGALDYLRKSAAFLLGAGIALATAYVTPSLLWRALKIATPVWFGFAAMRYVFPELYFRIVVPLVPTVVESDLRGSSSLAPEATDFGYTMVFMVAFCMLARWGLRRQGVESERWPLGLAALSAVLSKSGTGIFGLAAIGALLLLSRGPHTRPKGTFVWRLVGAAVVVGSAALVLRMLPDTGIRGVDLLSDALRDPQSLMNSTVSYRVIHNVVGILGLLDSHFRGYGSGAFTVIAPQLYYSHALGSVFGLTGYYASSVPLTLGQSPLSYIAAILLEYGVIGSVYLIVVFGRVIRSHVPFKAIVVVLLFVAWGQSFPAAWPPFWVLLGLTLNSYFAPSGRDRDIAPA